MTEEQLQQIRQKAGITDEILERNRQLSNNVSISNTKISDEDELNEMLGIVNQKNTDVNSGVSATFDGAVEKDDGFVKETISTLDNVMQGMGKAQLKTAKSLLAPIIDLPKNIASLFGKDVKGIEELTPDELFETQNKQQEIGESIGQIMQFFLVPQATGSKVLGAANATKLQKAANVVLKGLQEAGITTTLSTLQEGEFGEEQMKEGAIAGAIPIGMAGVKQLSKLIGNTVANIVGKVSRVGDDSIVELFKRPELVKISRQYKNSAGQLQDDVLDAAKKSVEKLVKERSDDYLSRLSNIDTGARNAGILDDVKNATKKVMDDFDIVETYAGKTAGKTAKGVNLANSTIVEGENVVKKVLEKTLSYTDDSVKGLDKLKRQLNTFSSQLSGKEKKEAKKVVDTILNSIKSSLDNNVSGYKELTSGYREASQLLDEINAVFNISGNKETAFNKLVGSFKPGKENRVKLLSYLGGDLSDKIIASRFTDTARGGVLSGIANVVGIGGILADGELNSKDIPYIIAMALLSSPRATGEITSALGKTTKAIEKVAPTVQRGLSATTSQIIEE